MRIAITGATGFIGRHVLKRLSAEQVDIVCVGRQPTTRGNVGTYVTLSLEDATEKVFEQLGQPDVLMHLAWGGLPNYRSLHHFDRELPLQYRFVRLMVEGGLRHVLGVGTCFEYGMQSGPLHESTATSPANPYGFAKDVFRQQLEYLADRHGARATWARLFYVWGPGQGAGSLFPLMQAAAARGDECFNMSQGEQLRDFLPVTEVADALVRLALHPSSQGIVNVCSGRPISVRRLAEQWVEIFGWKLRLNLDRLPYPDYEPLAFWGDANKLHGLLHGLLAHEPLYP
jgi:nucleoside-diphosphate-sugar epimerase